MFVGGDVPKQNATRPSSQGSMTNGYQFVQSPSSQQTTCPSYPPPAQNDGMYQHHQSQYGAAQPFSSPPQNRPAPSSPQQQSARPGDNYPLPPSYPPAMSNGPARSPPSQTSGHYPLHSNGTLYQYQNYPPGQRPLAPSPKLQQHQHSKTANGQPVTSSGRLPSPVVNRPTMSPTQGNMDVGPVAGIPLSSQGVNGDVARYAIGPAKANGTPSHLQATPRPTSQSQSQQPPAQTPTPTQPLSGLSPRKQQTPQPFPSPTIVSAKANPNSASTALAPGTSTSKSPNFTSPTIDSGAITAITAPSIRGGGPATEKRSVSGTPILPPVENLRPSPEQLRNMSSTEPVPTPSKQMQPPQQQVQPAVQE